MRRRGRAPVEGIVRGGVPRPDPTSAAGSFAARADESQRQDRARYNTKRTLRKAYATRHKETQALLSKQDEDALRTTQSTLDLRTLQKEPTIAPPEEAKDDQDATADATADATTSAAAAPPKSSDAEAPPSSELQALLAAESVQFPPWAWKMVVSMTLFTMLYGILKTNVFNQCATWLVPV